MNFDRLVEISKALKGKQQTGRAFHTTFAMRNGKIFSIGINNYLKTHPMTRNYISRFGNQHSYTSGIHSESDICAKLKMDDMSEFNIINIRIMNNGELGMAAPCPNCYDLLINRKGVRKLYYSDTMGGFSKIVF